MKILAINGSPRTVHSNTRRLTSFVLEGAAEAGAETEIIDLCDFRITPCTACEACSINGVCVNEDDVPGILARMREADGIVFASPVYIDNITGQMKVFFDRLADAIHYQVLTGKYGCAVVTTYDSGAEEVVAYLSHVLNYLGVIAVGSIGIATQGEAGTIDAKEPEARVLGKKLAGAIRDGFSDPVQEKILAENRGYFRTIVEENKEMRPAGYEEWVRKGWMD
ncbi:MAG: Iron-sulfur flavoprotein [Methanoregula sp. PtaU1.Bin051]|nr:MAG: Iron-sulfur flavoprotein [Methanoregula sp. PtaU1.Bin051]